MLDLRQLLEESYSERELICEGGAGGSISHLYNDGKLSFGQMRQIFYDVFQGKTVLKEKVDGQNIMVTYKNGKVCFARNKASLKEPMDIDKLGRYFDGNPKVKEAFVTSANNFTKALNSIETKDLNKLFANGQNFANVEIVYPPCKNILDYGNRCLLQLNGVDVFDENFNKITEDEEASKWLYETLKKHDALKQEMYEITEPNILRIKNSVNANKALNMLMEDFEKMIDGYSLKTSIQDYANERLKRYIINVCNHNNIEVDRDCAFVRELADRLNHMSHKRPTKSDICTFAKKCGVNVHGEDYRKVTEQLESQKNEMNEEILRPVENIVMKAGTLLLKNLSGFMSADPSKTSQKLVNEVEETISAIESDNSKLTADKLKIFRKNVKKLSEWQEKFIPSEGIVVKINTGNGTAKTYKIVGSFGVINQILHLLGR